MRTPDCRDDEERERKRSACGSDLVEFRTDPRDEEGTSPFAARLLEERKSAVEGVHKEEVKRGRKEGRVVSSAF